jgi:[ribosomal protein S18]-alanine N-acetyltransferase
MIVVPKVTLARAIDAQAIAAISRDDIEQGLGWSWTRHRVLAAIRDRSINVAVIHDRGCVMAFGIMQYGEQKAHLSLLGVDRARRRRGLGTQLVRWLEKCADTAGIERIQVEARADNQTAIAFYKKLGYSASGRVTGYYQGVLDAVRFEKRLWGSTPG